MGQKTSKFLRPPKPTTLRFQIYSWRNHDSAEKAEEFLIYLRENEPQVPTQQITVNRRNDDLCFITYTRSTPYTRDEIHSIQRLITKFMSTGYTTINERLNTRNKFPLAPRLAPPSVLP
ncbi:uncharacterized protein L201_000183 [Kwoniella dendrophila CBS 6074]|uniref:Uncharacterized protein n=1 Tax=Kwoniella dendrophila CBS 6074 TaxID=1295534 RepID=A0AAX4JIM5_9TREE